MNENKIISNVIIEQIIPNNKNYLNDNIIISMLDNYLIINTNANEYILKIKKFDNIYYWLLYLNNILILKCNINNDFDKIINYIKEIEYNKR